MSNALCVRTNKQQNGHAILIGFAKIARIIVGYATNSKVQIVREDVRFLRLSDF